jgi:hypothetical protein
MAPYMDTCSKHALADIILVKTKSTSMGCGENVYVASSSSELEVTGWLDLLIPRMLNSPQQIWCSLEKSTWTECPGHIAEIDKAIFSKIKYNRGRPVCSQMVFGGGDHHIGECLLQPVKGCMPDMLLQIQKGTIKPDINVNSDLESLHFAEWGPESTICDLCG